MREKKLTVVIPFYREAKTTLITAIDKLIEYLSNKKISFEIIITENGIDKKIVVIKKNVKTVFDKKRGFGRAIKNAVKYAKGDFLYCTSADIPFGFTDLDVMLNLIDKYDFIVGSKLHSASIYKINFIRKIITYGQYFLTALLLPSFLLKDPNGSFIMKLSYMKELIHKVKSDNFFFNTELAYLARKKNIRITEIPVRYIKSNFNTSVNILIDVISCFFQLIRLSAKEYLSRRMSRLLKTYVY